MKKKIVLRICGGVLNDVYVSPDMAETEVELIDYDNLEAEGLCSDERNEKFEIAIKGLDCIY
jgi:hypothetical protein